jgi:GNAT superfamily N-acetyltransferase
MSGEVTRGAMWVLKLQRLDRLGPNSSGYMLAETSMEVAELAAAMEAPASVIRERLERGCRVFVAWSRADAVAAWLWVSTGQERADPLRMDLRFAPDECYGWDAGALPRHRGHGLFTALLRYAGRRMAQEGYRWMWGGILDSNLASRHSCVAAGFRPVLRVTAILEPPPTRIESWPADYADEDLVERALRVLAAPTTGLPGEARNGSEAVVVAAGRRR